MKKNQLISVKTRTRSPSQLCDRADKTGARQVDGKISQLIGIRASTRKSSGVSIGVSTNTNAISGAGTVAEVPNRY
ncbi:MAG: hypothetical protein EBE86_017650 [Hormoscilla sp. GUM202]|nr:hypothetical protein [Hormoscilla sp. GM7CHS1pb]MBO1349091.1 hypothetical protein [Hormoscilla sp. GUM202]